MDCRTCEALQSLKQIRREINQERRDRGQKPVRTKLTAAVVDRSFRGRTTYYTTGRGRRIPLNYCPECGRYLKRTTKGEHENNDH